MMWPVSKLHPEQLVQIFALRRGFEPLRSDCTVSRTDGVDLHEVMQHEIRSLYAKALMELPLEQLPTENATTQTSLIVLPDGSAVVDLPTGTVRTGEVKLSSWMRSTVPLPADHPVAQIQSNRWSRGLCHEPVAVLRGNRVYLYSPDKQGDAIELLEVVRMPDAESFYAVTEPIMTFISSNLFAL
ncbi:MAG: hypothetical protein K2O88_01985 [Paramuribaculum sp.]|nr:hypothetical protein [Paramuribaculum sp.]